MLTKKQTRDYEVYSSGFGITVLYLLVPRLVEKWWDYKYKRYEKTITNIHYKKYRP